MFLDLKRNNKMKGKYKREKNLCKLFRTNKNTIFKFETNSHELYVENEMRVNLKFFEYIKANKRTQQANKIKYTEKRS